MSTPPSELRVITEAKNLAQYILTVTESSPKKFRFTFTSRIQNAALDIVEQLAAANMIYIGDDLKHYSVWLSRQDCMKRRYECQLTAFKKLKLLEVLIMPALEQKAITPKWFEQISLRVSATEKLLRGWMNSDGKRKI